MGNLSISRQKWLRTPAKDIDNLWGHGSLGSAILFEGNKVLMIKGYWNTDVSSINAD